MIKKLTITSLFCVLLFGSLFAQSDTVFVPATDNDGNPLVNSIIEYIIADTNAAGEQLHSVYKLERGQWYLLDIPANFYNPVKIVADPPSEGVPPAKIVANYLPETLEAATGDLLEAYADITLENIWLAGTVYSGGDRRGWGDGQALTVRDSFVTVTMKNVWVDYNGWSVFSTAVPHTSWIIDGLHVRNEMNPGDQWTTFIFFLETSQIVDKFIARNCTFFQINSFVIFPPPVVQYIEFDHCTFVNSYKWPFHRTEWYKAKFTNNIFYNSGSLGLLPGELAGQDPDALMYGLINADTLFANSSDTIPAGPYTIPENQREIEVRSNVYYWTDDIQQYLQVHDSVVAPIWMNSRTEAMFANDTDWPGLVEENNVNQDPQFNSFPALQEAVDFLAVAVRDVRTGNTHEWDWDDDKESDPEFYRLTHPYPLPENFAYSGNFTSTDGYHVGSLQYYPEEWAEYKENVTGVDDENGNIPQKFSLNQNYPNPFNPSTTISFDIAEQGNFSLKIYNVLGQELATLVNGEMKIGSHTVNFDASNLASGLYIYKLSGNNVSLTRKMMLLK
ncbi:MAG: T9SS type A sorting domain-containing protein [Ignavibacteriaceae bacterium]